MTPALVALALAAAPGDPSDLRPPTPKVRDDPAALALDRRRLRVQTGGMALLTAWSIANLGGGLAGNLLVPVGRDARYFHQMNWAWNTVNLTLGAVGLVSARRDRRRARPRPRAAVEADITRAQRVFAVNALLDVVYMVGGYATWELGKDRESPRLRGYGQAVVLQGAFLLAFDLAMILAHEPPTRLALAPLAAPGARGLALISRF